MVMFSFLILGTAFVFLGRSYVISEYRDNMVSNAEEVSHAAQALVRDGELSNWDLRMVISTLAQSTGNHIFITDTDGTIVSCSCRNIACEHLGRTVGSAQLTQLRSDGKFNLITNLGGFYASPHYVVAQPITIGTDARVIGYVFVATNSATIIDGWRTFVWVFLAASAAVMMIALLLSLVTSKRMAQPLDEMAVAAKKFAHGDFSARVTDDGRTDEVGALISAFNTMADSLETSEQRRNAFIANVSHELKTPMTTIAGFADGILDGTIGMIATDHAPHSAEEKSRGLEKSLMGVVGLETAFPILYTKLVKTGVLSLEKLIELMHTNPRNRFCVGTPLEEGQPASLTVYDLDKEYTINPDDFLSMGRATPFAGEKVFGACRLTMYHGSIAWKDETL